MIIRLTFYDHVNDFFPGDIVDIHLNSSKVSVTLIDDSGRIQGLINDVESGVCDE